VGGGAVKLKTTHNDGGGECENGCGRRRRYKGQS